MMFVSGFLVLTVAVMHSYCQTTTLTPDVADVIEGSDVTLVCKVSHVVTYTSWKLSNVLARQRMIYEEPECSAIGFIETDTDKYSYACNSTVYQLTIHSVQRSQHNEVWTCIAAGQSEGPDSVIKVTVPITSVTITPPTSTVDIEENNSKNFTCVTSEGHPAATVSWYKIESGVRFEINQNTTETQNMHANGFIVTTSVLSFVPRRTQNGTKIYCEASNTDNGNKLKSSEKQLNVLYKAVGPTIAEGSDYRFLENVQGRLHCEIEGGNPTPSLKWNCNNNWSSSVSQDGGTVTNTLSWTTARSQDRICTCTSQQSPFPNKTVSINVIILYPPSTPTFKVDGNTISEPIRFIEGKARSIQCVADSKPPPQSYTWTKAQSTAINGQYRTFNNVQRSNAGQYSCEVQNTMNPSRGGPIIGNNTSTVLLQVLYQPSIIKFYFGENIPIVTSNMIDVIQGDNVSITCNATDGNPAADKYKWSENSKNGRVWTLPSILHNKSDMCTATNTLLETGTGVKEKKSTSDIMKINVLVPPAITECKFRYSTQDNQTDAPETLKIIIGHSISLSCAVTGTPRPMTSWEGPILSKYSSELILRNVNKTNDGQYTFLANSTLMRTFGTTERRNKSRKFQIDILYPPKIGNLSVMDIEEGTRLDKLCPFTPGNPPKTTAKWTKNINDKIWNKEVLTIPSVSRSDDANYTCEIYNVMEPTSAPQVREEGKDTGTFHLNVQYKAMVTSLYVLGFETNTNVTTVNETNPLKLKCTVISNPLPTIQIRKGDTPLNSSTGNMNLLYFIGNAICLNAGIYTCYGSNEVNKGEEASRQLQVNVNCSPRPADTVTLNRTSETNETFTFTFNAIAYPVPVFIWKKWVGDEWKRMQNDENVRITSFDLQSNLTIQRLGQGDFGKYLLNVSNDFGGMEFHYQLEQDDKPDVPTDFRHLATESSIQLKWQPGFNGGPPQTFYIRYRKSSSSTWNYVSVIDTGEKTMQYMLNGLESDTQYQVIIYSSNSKGNSSESEPLLAKTKAEGPSIGAMVGGAVGGGVGCAILVIIAIIVLRRYRFSKGDHGSDTELKRRSISESSEEEDGMRDNPMYGTSTVAAVAGSSGTDNIYSKPQKQKKPKAGNVSGNGDIYAVVNKPKKNDKKKQKKEKSSAVKSQTGDVYENVEPKKDPRKGDTTYENPDEIASSKQPKKKNVNKDGLIYADLAFNDQQKGQKKLVIIGSDDRTPYAQVDFTKKADPLPESDEENP